MIRIINTPKTALWFPLMTLLVLFISCSTTKNLPEGETLYTGIKRVEIQDRDKTKAGENTLDEVKAALNYAPNNALFGSSTTRYPFPLGLWVYNLVQKKEKGLGKWIFDKLATKPIFISTVNPDIRAKVAQNILIEQGYFNAQVSYEVVKQKNNPQKAKLSYFINAGKPYQIDSIEYAKYSDQLDSLLHASKTTKKIQKGDYFSATQLELERERLSDILRNGGYYFFRPDFITFLADTTQQVDKVSLLATSKSGIPLYALEPWKIKRTAIHLLDYNQKNRSIAEDSLKYKELTIYYQNQLKVRPKLLYDRIKTEAGQPYSQEKQKQTQLNLNQLGIFRYSDLKYTPLDTLNNNNLLNLSIYSEYDLPYDGELEFNVTTKSNDQAGPGMLFSLSKKNVFHGGETFSIQLKGVYEWQTRAHVDTKTSLINSYEIGLTARLNIPYLVFPGLTKKQFSYPTNTNFRLYLDQLNQSSFFQMNSLGASASYRLEPTKTSRHTFVPLKLTYTILKNTTALFDSITNNNPALFSSLNNQFIPAASYTYAYDNSNQNPQNQIWWESTITSAGNITAGIASLLNIRSSKTDKLTNPIAQFTKLTSELRHNHKLSANQRIVSRLFAGAIYAYGNSIAAPYNEQFFSGGANSIRAFTARSIGPGSYRPQTSSAYAYMDQIGDLKIEANVEYRFNLIGALEGACFLDAGNVWLLKENSNNPGGVFNFKNLPNDVALGTGFGFRYDLTFLVVRFDLGIGLHTPYRTGKGGYYNIPTFTDGLGYHIAIGYPF